TLNAQWKKTPNTERRTSNAEWRKKQTSNPPSPGTGSAAASAQQPALSGAKRSRMGPTPNPSRKQTSNAERRTPNAGYGKQMSNTQEKRKTTPNAQRPTPNAQ